MMRKSTGHKERYSIKSEISRVDSNDGTAARTRPFSFDEIMARRKKKKQSESVEDQGVASETVYGRVESDRHRRRDIVGGGEQHASKESLQVVSRTKEKIVESEYRESYNTYRRSKVDDDSVKDSRKERVVYEKRDNYDRSTDDFGYEHRKRHEVDDDSAKHSRKERGVHEQRKNHDRSTDDFVYEHGKRHGLDDDSAKDRRERGAHEKRKNHDRSIDDFDYEHQKRHEVGDDRAKDSRKEKSVHEKRKTHDRATDDFGYEHGKRHEVDDDSEKDSRKERGIHEKRKNYDKSTDDFDHEHGKRHSKEYAVKDRDRGKSEHVSKRTQTVYDDSGAKHESRKWHDSTTSEKKHKKSTSESHHEDYKSRSKRSRSREHERDKSKRSKSPSPRGQKHRHYDAREHEELSSHSAKDVKKVSNNGLDNKIKRHDTSSSGLGGYSPRKRRSEAAVKTPSINNHSPEKKNAGWDSPPVKMESSFPSLNKTVPSNIPITPSIYKPAFGVISSITPTMNVSVDSVQLTQATRPQRRIYVENLPSSASETAVMQWLTSYLRPFGLTHVQSTSPCISCIVNKEKGQALVEFLTPEDASAALNFDGKSFSGNIVKIRRPKDYVEAKASTGVSENPVARAVPVKNIVEDSPNKMFIGGISKVITSEMLMEIASAFGPIKAYHFENNAHLHSPCAFVEYADQSVTVKACVGLNGMKLGGQVLTVTQATPDASLVGNHGDQPFYGTPVHARPLLEKPTQVLKLNNVLDPHSLPSLSESELEEILEDIRLECARFGVVKSVNIIKQPEIRTSSEMVEATRETDPMADEATKETDPMADEVTKEANPMVDEATDEANPMEGEAIEEAKDANHMADEVTKEAKPMVDEVTKEATLMVDEVTEHSCSDNLQPLEEPANENKSNTDPEKVDENGGMDGKDERCADIETENRSLNVESHDTMECIASDMSDAFELGCVLVEYKRTEASSTAAHCLHGRVFDGRSVSVEYVAYDVYRTRFRK